MIAVNRPCVEVAVFCPLRQHFHYLWPEAFGHPRAGVRVRVPFGRQQRTAVVLAITEPPTGIELRPVTDVLDARPPCPDNWLQWVARVQRYYLAAPGVMYETALGWLHAESSSRWYCPDPKALAQQFPDWQGVFRNRSKLTLRTVLARADMADARHQLHQLVDRQLVKEAAVEPVWLDRARHGAGSLPTLNSEQQHAADAIISGMGAFCVSLLFGRTGSGKTEVYLEAARHCVNAGQQVLILVPEIGLTPMWQQRLAQRFDKVLIWHSALSNAQRLAAIRHLAKAEVIIGTRSALFLPLPQPGMIVIDEEHDSSLKQNDGVCYSARDAALLLAQQYRIPLVLGSATPSLESWRLVREGRCQLLTLSKQAVATEDARLQVIDMRQYPNTILSPPLLQALADTHDRGEQSILFLNRRGYAPALQCVACGYVIHCPDCSLRLTLHRSNGELRCHVCGFSRRTPRSCEQCGEASLLPMGSGTERLDELLTEQLPNIRLARFDRDAISTHQKLMSTLKDFEAGNIDCLIGTQMLVKGHDFHNVTLVAVVHADMGLSIPDFRASERWWQQMTQVMGRAGRGTKTGTVLIQTWMPDAPWLQRIHADKARITLDEELALRQQLTFPPFARWVRLLFSGRRAEATLQCARQWHQRCQCIPDIQVMAATPCPLERQAGRYRFEVLLRDDSRQQLPWMLEPVLQQLPLTSGVRLRVDVDPLDMS